MGNDNEQDERLLYFKEGILRMVQDCEDLHLLRIIHGLLLSESES